MVLKDFMVEVVLDVPASKVDERVIDPLMDAGEPWAIAVGTYTAGEQSNLLLTFTVTKAVDLVDACAQGSRVCVTILRAASYLTSDESVAGTLAGANAISLSASSYLEMPTR